MIPELVSRRGSETVEVAFFLALEHALRNVHFEKPVLIVRRACFRVTDGHHRQLQLTVAGQCRR